MLQNLNQVKHNEDFVKSLCANFEDTYFDWKITATFYCAYHLLQALASHRKVSIGNRHNDMLWNINPRNTKRTLKIKNDAFEAYDQLFEYSRTARYDGFSDFQDFQLMKKEDYKHCAKIYNYLKKYISSNSVQLP